MRKLKSFQRSLKHGHGIQLQWERFNLMISSTTVHVYMMCYVQLSKIKKKTIFSKPTFALDFRSLQSLACSLNDTSV